MKSFKILAFDGGGVRGALSVRILKKLCEKHPNLLNEIDLFAGTSTGSIIALALAYGISIDNLDNLYSYEVTKKIFSPSRFNLFKPKFSNKNLKIELSKYFPDDLTIGDLKKHVYVPTFNVKGLTNDSWEAVFINNLTPNETSSFTVIDAALASSAAPTYFPSHNNFIDGGVVANSPTAACIFSSLNAIRYRGYSREIKLLSIGTGDSSERIHGNTEKWGIFQWSFHPFTKMHSPLVSLLMDGMCDLEDIYCREFLKSNYFRINPPVSKFIEMDNYKFVPYLKALAENVDLTPTCSFIENIFLKN
ncbi:patatin-like phospholipase family protein [Clostridium sp.]|uniref:patatin-like phospholipase family protein n=1 Tax=Clostridium sp. TaxID=1506 RepID=UPI003F400963